MCLKIQKVVRKSVKANPLIEVKATINLQVKSLKSYREKFPPKISIRTSLADYEEHNSLINLPLYDIGNFEKIIL